MLNVWHCFPFSETGVNCVLKIKKKSIALLLGTTKCSLAVTPVSHVHRRHKISHHRHERALVHSLPDC